jgi:hypothetical protein
MMVVKYLCACILVALACARAVAVIIVEYRPSALFTYTQIQSITVTQNPQPVTINFQDLQASDPYQPYIRIYSTNPLTESLGTVSFLNQGSGRIRLLVATPGGTGNGPFNQFVDPGSPAVNNWIGNVSDGFATTAVIASVGGNLSGQSVAQLSRLKVGGAISSSITHMGGGGFEFIPGAIITCGSVSSSATINIQQDSLISLMVEGNMQGGVACSGIASVGSVSVDGDLTGTISTSNGSVGSVQVDGRFGGQVTAGGSISGIINSVLVAGQFDGGLQAGSSLGQLIVGSSTSGASIGRRRINVPGSNPPNSTILVPNGNIGSIRVFGYLYADISAGTIGPIEADMGIANLVSGVNPPQLRAASISATNGGITSIKVNGEEDMWADISALNGTISTISVGDGMTTTRGNFAGSIRTQDIGSRVDIYGDFGSGAKGTIELTRGHRAGRVIRIGGSINSAPAGSGITLHTAARTDGAVGLAGQIIVNAKNTGGMLGASIRLLNATGTPDTVINSAAYANLPASLGGGAVGLAPYSVHLAASTPARDQLNPGQGILETTLRSAAIPIKIEHYGPIEVNGDILVQCRPIGATGSQVCNWQDLSPAFEVIEPGTNGLNARTLGIRVRAGQTAWAGEYRVTFEPGALRCIEVPTTPDVNWPEPCPNATTKPSYVFRVGPDCDNNGVDDQIQSPGPNCATNCAIADFNHSGAISVQDIFDFLDAWFNGCTGQGTPNSSCVRSADVNNSNSVTVQDIFDFLASWFTC